jgi:hypothetical protein
MTAEIAVLNKYGVALAADSAVTIGENGKVYNSANKLFLLSKFHPVGIMIYGNAEFMGVPWETIIKQYRRKHGSTPFNTLEDYAKDFFLYLSTFNFENDEKVQVSRTIDGYFQYLIGLIEKEVERHIKTTGKITNENTIAITNSIVQKENDIWAKYKHLANFPKSFIAVFLKTYAKLLREALRVQFQKIPLDKKLLNSLLSMTPYLYCKNRFPDEISGLVFAGFGEDEIFPKVRSYKIESKIFSYLKYEYDRKRSENITESNTASVIPFAQIDMVATFMEGIDPKLYSFSENYLSSLFEKFPLAILEKLGIKDGKKKGALHKELQQLSKKLHTEFIKELFKYRRSEHINPIVEMVAVLPLDELALMAEALVNLTSFKRRVTAEAETVGGPIDVAVISKGDGFVWITRKHYFKPELNHHFFSNYYREHYNATAKNQ